MHPNPNNKKPELIKKKSGCVFRNKFFAKICFILFSKLILKLRLNPDPNRVKFHDPDPNRVKFHDPDPNRVKFHDPIQIG